MLGPWLRDTPFRDPGRRHQMSRVLTQGPELSQSKRDRDGLPSSLPQEPGARNTMRDIYLASIYRAD